MQHDFLKLIQRGEVQIELEYKNSEFLKNEFLVLQEKITTCAETQESLITFFPTDKTVALEKIISNLETIFNENLPTISKSEFAILNTGVITEIIHNNSYLIQKFSKDNITFTNHYILLEVKTTQLLKLCLEILKEEKIALYFNNVPGFYNFFVNITDFIKKNLFIFNRRF